MGYGRLQWVTVGHNRLQLQWVTIDNNGLQ